MDKVHNATGAIACAIGIAGDGGEVGVERGANDGSSTGARSLVLNATWMRSNKSDCGIVAGTGQIDRVFGPKCFDGDDTRGDTPGWDDVAPLARKS